MVAFLGRQVESTVGLMLCVAMSALGQTETFCATQNLVCFTPDNGHKFRESGHRHLNVCSWGLSRSFGGMPLTSESSHNRTLETCPDDGPQAYSSPVHLNWSVKRSRCF